MVVGKDLQSLVDGGLIDDTTAYDQTSVSLRLHRRVLRIRPPVGAVIDYGAEIPSAWCEPSEISSHGLTLEPHAAILGCSEEQVRMTSGFMGLIQTKGSLARLFVTVTCCDGQIDMGYEGRVTFEICNLGNFAVRIRALQPVAQMFVLDASTTDVLPYDGRYQGAQVPTRQVPERQGGPDEFEKLFEAARTAEGSHTR
jgi:dCTP deaminase